MKVTQKWIVLTVGIALIFSVQIFSAAQASSDNPGMEELMGEGITFAPLKQDTVVYRGDSSTPSREEMMTEGVVYPKKSTPGRQYAYDNSTPSASELMGEGIILKPVSAAPVEKQIELTASME